MKTIEVMKSYNYDYAEQYLRSVSAKNVALQVIVIFVLATTYGYAWTTRDGTPLSGTMLSISTATLFLMFSIPSYVTLHFAKRDACFEASYFAHAGMLFSILTGAIITIALLFLFQDHSAFVTIIMGAICGGLGGAGVGTLFILVYWGLFISRDKKIRLGVASGWIATIIILIKDTLTT